MRLYSRSEVEAVVESVHRKVGDEPFMTLGLMALEKLVRRHATGQTLPGKTVLREVLNGYRAQRWPTLAPKKMFRRY